MTTPTIDRKLLAAVFTDPKTLRAVEKTFASAITTEIVANQAAVDADNAQVDATSALSLATGLANGPSYVTLATSATLANERVLTGGTGVTITAGAPGGNVTITVNVVGILGYTPANRAGDTFTGPVVAPSADIQGGLTCDSLRVDVAPTATATASTHSIPININGTIYYMRLSATP